MQNEAKCLYCGVSDQQVPLVVITYKGQQLYICTEHLPVAIHHRDQMMGQLEQAVAEKKQG